MSPSVTVVAFTVAPPRAVADGLLGWAEVVLNDAILITNVQVRRARDGHQFLAFPTRTDRWGRRHHMVRPLDDAARVAIESQVFAALRRQGRSAS